MMRRAYCWLFHWFFPVALGRKSRLYTVALWNRGCTKTCDTCETTFHFSD